MVTARILTYTTHSFMSAQQDLETKSFHLQLRKISLRKQTNKQTNKKTLSGLLDYHGLQFMYCIERGWAGGEKS